MLLNEIEPNQLALLSVLIAIELSTDRNINEINLLGDLLIAIGSVMVTIAAQQQNQQDDQREHEQMQEKIKKLEEQVAFLKNAQSNA